MGAPFREADAPREGARRPCIDIDVEPRGVLSAVGEAKRLSKDARR